MAEETQVFGDCPCEFPQQVSVVCLVDIAQLVLSGEVASNWPEALRHAACLAGSAANQFGNQPLFGASGPADAAPFGSEQEAAQFIIDNCKDKPAEQQFGAIDPGMLWAAVKVMLRAFLLQLLQ